MQFRFSTWTILSLQIAASLQFDVYRRLYEMKLGGDGGNVSECEVVLGSVYERKDDWARCMSASTSKLQSKILASNRYEFGSFDDCIAIQSVEEFGVVYGKYCLGSLQLDNSSLMKLQDLKWAMCIPHFCSVDEVNAIMKKAQVPVQFNEIFCQSRTSQAVLTLNDKLALAFFIVVALLLLTSTAYDVILHYLDQKHITPRQEYQSKHSHDVDQKLFLEGSVHEALIAFSIYTNGRKLFMVNTDLDRLACVDGLRSISTMWLVYTHIFLYAKIGPVTNNSYMNQWFQSAASLYALRADIAVDTFFVLGGLVVIYSYLSMELTGENFNVLAYYVHRYIRLTPAVAALLLVHVTLLDNIISGPLQPMTGPFFVDSCTKYWWSTLLYVQNYVNTNEWCIGVTWYLCVDMQLIILSPLLLLPLRKFPKYIITIAGLLTLTSIVLASYTAWTYKLNPESMTRKQNVSKFYTANYIRASSWLVGFILGYFVYQIKRVYLYFKMNKFLVVFLWALTFAVMAVCVFAGNELRTDEADVLLGSLFASLVKPSWAIAVAWIVLACISGYGGPVNAFLSMPIFQILARLSYCIYLTHFTIIGAVEFSTRTTTYFSNLNMMLDYWKYFMLTVGVSILWSLTFEFPIVALEKCVKNVFRCSTKKKIETTVEKK